LATSLRLSIPTAWSDQQNQQLDLVSGCNAINSRDSKHAFYADPLHTSLNRWLRVTEKKSDQVALPPDAGFWRFVNEPRCR
jgi:hypothetical protein